MGIFDKAKDALDDNIEQVDAGIDKAADFVDDKTGNKYTEQIDQGAEFVKDKLEDFANDTPAAPAQASVPAEAAAPAEESPPAQADAPAEESEA
jgi:ABC-type transporter Mla subunit MlaD